ncbi:MAG: TldD/PmbA family protein [Micromonosporaceae bacterium]|nr:TldD/PmbA family protein [Micromonosporaceae bacterium]
MNLVSPQADEYEVVRRALLRSTSVGVDSANVFIERRRKVAVRFADSRIVDLAVSRRAGSCARWISSRDSRYRAVDSIDPSTVALCVGGDSTQLTRLPTSGTAGGAIETAEDVKKLVGELDRAARDTDSRVRQVLVDAEWQEQLVVVVTLDGIVAEKRHLRYLTVRVVAGEGCRVAAGFYTPASSDPSSGLDPVQIGREAARRAVTSLAGWPVPPRRMPVVVGPGRGMVLIHEACCHPLEADEISRGSIYAGCLGQRIAAPGVSIVDDPLVPTGVGTYQWDDEGTPASATIMVEDGILRSYLTDAATAVQLGVRKTSNGRREGFLDIPIPRMSNTCVRPGDLDPEQIIANTTSGLYAQHVGGGEVVEATGDFAFRVLNGFLIEDGKLADPVQETTVQGNGTEVLLGIDAVGNDVRLGAAKCGKFSALVPVGVQGPTLRIRSLLVGGTGE